MSDLRNLCGCGHAASRHEDGPCRTCSCPAWSPAYPVLDALPAGVTVLRDCRAQALAGLSLVECEHHAQVVRAGYPDLMCAFCRASGERLGLPVVRLVFAPKELTLL